MAGQVVRVVSLREYDFESLANSGETTVTVEEHIDVSQYRNATLCARWHSGTIPADGGAGSISVTAYADGYTMEDPANIFIGATALNTAITFTGGTDQAPSHKTAELTAGAMGAMVLVRIKATNSGSGQDDFDPVLSIDLVLKDS